MSNKLVPLDINGREYKGYTDSYWFMMEQILETSPQRSTGSGAMTNINDINRFYVPHCWIDFAYMDIEKFRQFYIDTQPIEMTIGCYDTILDKKVYHKMYLAPRERQKMRMYCGEVYGIYDTKLEFIGTNNAISNVNITYMPNGATGSISDQSVKFGQEFQIKDSQGLVYDGKTFDYWSDKTDGSGSHFNELQVTVASTPMTLYAIWKDTNKRVLSYNYVQGKVALDENNEPIYNKDVIQGQAVDTIDGKLPNVEPKNIIYDGKTIAEPYAFMGWYSLINGQGSKWTNDTIYNIQGNTIIYAYMLPQNFTISFNSMGGNYTPTSITQPYASNVYPPYNPIKDGYNFGGWFLDSEYTKPFSFTTMPPESITLYAKWIEE